MITINLRDYYPFYLEDTYIEVTDEIASELHSFDLADEANRIRIYRAKAFYSLNRDDGIELEAKEQPPTPEELFDRDQTSILLREAMSSLTPKQKWKVYDYAAIGRSKVEIAEAEGVNERAIRKAIVSGLNQLRRRLKKYFKKGVRF